MATRGSVEQCTQSERKETARQRRMGTEEVDEGADENQYRHPPELNDSAASSEDQSFAEIT